MTIRDFIQRTDVKRKSLAEKKEGVPKEFHNAITVEHILSLGVDEQDTLKLSRLLEQGNLDAEIEQRGTNYFRVKEV